MSKIVIIDDRYFHAKRVKEEVKKYFNEDVEVLSDFDNEYIKTNDVELVFLDIDKTRKNVIDKVVNFKVDTDSNIEIIIVSDCDELMHYSMQINPVFFVREDYLKEDMHKAIELLYKNGFRNDASFFIARREIRYRDIVYIKSYKHYLIYYLFDGAKIRQRNKLTDIEEEMKKYFIVRCHQSYLINLRHVSDIQGKNIVLSNEIKVTISGTYKIYFNKMYMKFVLNKLK